MNSKLKSKYQMNFFLFHEKYKTFYISVIIANTLTFTICFEKLILHAIEIFCSS